MKDLSPRARIYILSVIGIGIFLLIWNIQHVSITDLWELLVITILASISLILKVEGSTNRSHYNISFLVYAFALVNYGPHDTAVVIVVSNLVEWVWNRYPWYIQTFNISSYMIVLNAAGQVDAWINPSGSVTGLLGVSGILATMAVFTILNHLLVGIVIWLARGENFSKSGIFRLFPLMLDFTLMCLGAAAAIIWQATPYAIVLALLPLYLIYTTLRVPALERQTETDAKTGLYNARYFERALTNELKRAQRTERPLAIVMADLDLLRNINNTYGHIAGDDVLKGVANILKSMVRGYDVVARIGGEEYAILMPETTAEEAYPRIEAIRQAIEQADFIVSTSVVPIKVTISFGIAGREGYNQSSTAIVHNADAALYHAKLRGRNGTFIYSNEGFIGLSAKKEEPAMPVSDFSERIRMQDIPYEPSSLRAEVESDPTEAAEGRGVARIERRNLPGWVVNVYITGLGLLALFLAYLAWEPGRPVDWLGLGIFTLIVVLTEWFSVDIYVNNTSVSTSAAPMAGGILMFGIPGAAIISLMYALAAFIKHRSPPNRLVFNASNQFIAAAAYLTVIRAFKPDFLQMTIWEQFVLCLAAVGIVYIITTLTVAIGISIDSEQTVREVWRERFGWLAPYYLAMGLLAFALIFSYQNAGVPGLLAILAPLLVLRYSQKLYIDRTRENVSQLKAKNQALEQSSQEILALNDELLETLAEMVDLRDPHVIRHSRQVAIYAEMIAGALGLPQRQVELVRKAGLLHDIGKVGVKDFILHKPATLTPEEYKDVKEHVRLGAELVGKSHSLKGLAPIIRHHHEWYNGSGYPDHLTNNDIPLEARILAVSDAIEAMASDRPYNRARSQEEVMAELERCSGTQFDPLIVRAFIDVVRNQGEPVVLNLSRAHEAAHPTPRPQPSASQSPNPAQG